MKKRIILASAIGLAGSLAYLLTRGGLLKGVKQAGGDGRGEHKSSQSDLDASRENKLQISDQKADQSAAAHEAEEEHGPLDDRGTDQAHASQMLRSIRDQAFEGSDEKLALALGRPTDEIERWASGAGTIDGDIVLKARSLANLRGINIEQIA